MLKIGEEIKTNTTENNTITEDKKLDTKKILNVSKVKSNPIDPTRISKEPVNCLNIKSAMKVGLVFLVTLGGYYLVKTKGIFSYFGWNLKNSKDVNNREIMELKNKENALSINENLETERTPNSPPLNQIVKIHEDKDRTLKFKEIEVEKFKNLHLPKNIEIHLTLKGSFKTPGSAGGVAIFENYAYVADDESGLQIIDITDPSNPTLKGSYEPSEPSGEIAISNNYPPHLKTGLLVDPSGLQIIDITDLVKPKSSSLLEIAISDNYAYLAAGSSGLQIIDISDPTNPKLKGSYHMDERDGWRHKVRHHALGIAVSGNYAYVAGSRILHIVDIRDPAKPKLKGSHKLRSYGKGIAISGNYAYVGVEFLKGSVRAGLLIIDIKDPSNPTLKSSYVLHRSEGIAISGNYAYVADWHSGLHIIDISNPLKPTFKGLYDTYPRVTRGVTLLGNYAYVAIDSPGSVLVIDIMDPTNPKFKDSYNTPSCVYGVAPSKNYVYVADRDSGLHILAQNLDSDSRS